MLTGVGMSICKSIRSSSWILSSAMMLHPHPLLPNFSKRMKKAGRRVFSYKCPLFSNTGTYRLGQFVFIVFGSGGYRASKVE